VDGNVRVDDGEGDRIEVRNGVGRRIGVDDIRHGAPGVSFSGCEEGLRSEKGCHVSCVGR